MTCQYEGVGEEACQSRKYKEGETRLCLTRTSFRNYPSSELTAVLNRFPYIVLLGLLLFGVPESFAIIKRKDHPERNRNFRDSSSVVLPPSFIPQDTVRQDERTRKAKRRSQTFRDGGQILSLGGGILALAGKIPWTWPAAIFFVTGVIFLAVFLFFLFLTLSFIKKPSHSTGVGWDRRVARAIARFVSGFFMIAWLIFLAFVSTWAFIIGFMILLGPAVMWIGLSILGLGLLMLLIGLIIGAGK